MRIGIGGAEFRCALSAVLLSMGCAVACGSDGDRPKPDDPDAGASNTSSAGTSSAGTSAGGVSSAGASGRNNGSGEGGSTGSEGGSTDSEGGSSATEGGINGDAGHPSLGEGGTAGAGNEDTINISPLTLAPARISNAYAAALTVTGKSDGLSWSVVGNLPPGLSLDSNGSANASIHGTPTRAGAYSFGIRVGAVTRQYSLRVRSAPWLAYTTKSGAFAVDLTSGVPSAPYTLSRALADNETPYLRAEQPGGTQLVFVIYDGTAESGWVANFSGTAPPPAVLIDSPGTPYIAQERWVWSGDGKRLGWMASTGANYATYHPFVADMTGAAPGPAYDISDTATDGARPTSLKSGGSAFFISEDAGTAGPGGTPGTRQLVAGAATLPPTGPSALTDWQGLGGTPAPDGSRLLYLERISSTAVELRVVGVGGAAPEQPVRLNPALSAAQTVNFNAQWTSDAANVVFAIDHYNGQDISRLYRARVGSDGPFLVEPLTDEAHWAGAFKLSPDGKRVLFTQGQSATSMDNALYVADLSTTTLGTPVRVSGSFVSGGSLFPYQSLQAFFDWSPDSKHVTYFADGLELGLREAFIVDAIDAPAVVKRVNTNLASVGLGGGNVMFSPDGSWIALETAREPELFLIPIAADGPGAAQRVAPSNANESYTGVFTWAADSSFFGYIAGTTAKIVAIKDGTVSDPITVSDKVNDTPHFLAAGF